MKYITPPAWHLCDMTHRDAYPEFIRRHVDFVTINQAVDETQERLEMLGGELDDMCRRLGMGDSFQVQRFAQPTDKSFSFIV